MTAIRVPPGRAGLLRLRRSLAVAEAGADLLARKLAMLGAERDRLARAATGSGRRWAGAAAEAQRWLDRTAQLDGDRVIGLHVPADAATVRTDWTSLMGLRYVSRTRCTLPVRPADDVPAGGSALARAEAAVRDAVPLAAAHAAAVQAVRVVDRETRVTRQRLRALEHRRIPRLREALTRAQAQVDELENADAVRRRWAGDGNGPAGTGRPALSPADGGDDGGG